jgi:hypothetical protein
MKMNNLFVFRGSRWSARFVTPLDNNPSPAERTGSESARPGVTHRKCHAGSKPIFSAIATLVLIVCTSPLSASGSVTLRGIATGSTATAANHVTVSGPRGIGPGDVMIAQVAVRGGYAQNLIAPAGWVLIRRDVADPMINQAIYRHVVPSSGSEPKNYTWNFNSGNYAAAGIADFAGVATVTSVDANGGQGNPSSTLITAPSITIPAGHIGDLLLGAFAIANGSTITVPLAAAGYGVFERSAGASGSRCPT